MSGDPEQEYFSDGLTEDIITDLSLLPGLFVIARNSTFTFKGKAVLTPGAPNKISAFLVRFTPRAIVTALAGRMMRKRPE